MSGGVDLDEADARGRCRQPGLFTVDGKRYGPRFMIYSVYVVFVFATCQPAVINTTNLWCNQ